MNFPELVDLLLAEEGVDGPVKAKVEKLFGLR